MIAIALSACGADADDDRPARSISTRTSEKAPSSVERAPGRECITPSRAAVKALEQSLTDGDRLRAARALPSADRYEGPAALREGAVFIAAKLDGKVPLVWLATADFVENGRGMAVAATAGTRRVSSLGIDEDPGSIGISSQSRGLAEVRECVDERGRAIEASARRARKRRAAQRARALKIRVPTSLTGTFGPPASERGGHQVDLAVATERHPSGDPSASGSVTVRLGGPQGQILGSHSVVAGRARWTLRPGDPGPYAVAAYYSGDATHKPSAKCLYSGQEGGACP